MPDSVKRQSTEQHSKLLSGLSLAVMVLFIWLFVLYNVFFIDRVFAATVIIAFAVLNHNIRER